MYSIDLYAGYIGLLTNKKQGNKKQDVELNLKLNSHELKHIHDAWSNL